MSESTSLRSLVHPNVPSDRTGFVISYRAASQLEGQLDLTVMVTLVPNHVLEQENRVVVVKVHVAVCLHPALNRVPRRLGAVVQHGRDAAGVALGPPLFLRHLSCELRG